MKLIVLLSMLSFNSLAETVSTGQVISAASFNNSVSHIGEIKSSILSSSQFQSLYGSCWRLMDGSPLSGTDLGSLTGKTHLPNMLTEGSSLKQVQGARELGSFETDGVKAHNHSINDPGHRHIEGTNAVNNNLRYGSTNAGLSNRRSESGSGTTFASFTETVATGISINNFGDTENKVKNTGVNFFIKVNETCN